MNPAKSLGAICGSSPQVALITRYAPGPGTALPAGSPSLFGHEKSPHQSDASDSQERRCILMARKRHLVCPFLQLHHYHLVESGLLWRKCSKVFYPPFLSSLLLTFTRLNKLLTTSNIPQIERLIAERFITTPQLFTDKISQLNRTCSYIQQTNV